MLHMYFGALSCGLYTSFYRVCIVNLVSTSLFPSIVPVQSVAKVQAVR